MATTDKIANILLRDTKFVEHLTSTIPDSVFDLPSPIIVRYIEKHKMGVVTSHELCLFFIQNWVERNRCNATVSTLAKKLDEVGFAVADDLKQGFLSSVEALITPMAAGNKSVERACSVPIVKLSNGKFIILEETMNEIFQKTSKSKVVIISVNGRARIGKSFRLNQLLKYAKSIMNPASETWVNTNLEERFDYGAGTRPITSGISLWSEPVPVSEDVSVILMDCQGLYDQQTSDELNLRLFAFSMLLSSVFVYMDDKQLSKDTENMILLFTKIAQLIQQGDGKTPILQRFVLLLRDFQSKGYPPGAHFPGTNSYADFVLEKFPSFKAAMEKTSEAFFCFLSNHPGSRIDPSVSISSWTSEFRDSVLAMARSIIDVDKIPDLCKRLGGAESLTGEEMKGYAEFLAEQFLKPENLAGLEGLSVSLGKWHGERLSNLCISQYEKDMQLFLQTNKYGIDDAELTSRHLELSAIAMNRFSTSNKGLMSEETVQTFRTLLEERIIRRWNELVSTNMEKLEHSKRLNAEIMKQEFASQAAAEFAQRSKIETMQAENLRRLADAGKEELKRDFELEQSYAQTAFEVAKESLQRSNKYLEEIRADKGTFSKELVVVGYNTRVNLVGETRSAPVYGTKYFQEMHRIAISSAELAVRRAEEAFGCAERRLRQAEAMKAPT